jgi:hypothetical protein
MIPLRKGYPKIFSFDQLVSGEMWRGPFTVFSITTILDKTKDPCSDAFQTIKTGVPIKCNDRSILISSRIMTNLLEGWLIAVASQRAKSLTKSAHSTTVHGPAIRKGIDP